jgi:hypothetical protein
LNVFGRVDQLGMIATLASWRPRVQIPPRPHLTFNLFEKTATSRLSNTLIAYLCYTLNGEYGLTKVVSVPRPLLKKLYEYFTKIEEILATLEELMNKEGLERIEKKP